MILFCAFNHKTSLVANNEEITLYDGEEGRTETLRMAPGDTVLAVAQLTESVVHILTHRGVYDLRFSGHDASLALTFVAHA